MTELLPEQRVFDDDTVFDRIEFVDFYRYVDVDLSELYRYLEENAPWVRPADTGRSTNCLINVAGIQVHQTERGYHNYAEPYSWDVRLGHKTRDEALEELDDQVDRRRRRSRGPAAARHGRVSARNTSRSSRRGIRPPTEPTSIPTSCVVTYASVSRRRRYRPRSSASTRCRSLRVQRPTRLRCPAPTRVHRQGTALVEPSTDVERALCEIWAEVLRIEQVGVTDDFFDLGGDSLAALEVVATVADTMGAALDDAAVFHARTVRELAVLIDGPVDAHGGVAGSDAGIPAVVGAPLSAGEEAMLFDYRRDPADTRYNVTRWYRLPADVDLDRLEQAFRDVAMLHGPLHTSFDGDRSELGRDAAVSFDRIAASSIKSSDRSASSSVRLRSISISARWCVSTSASTEDSESGSMCTSVMIGMHHISVDAGTFDVFWDQVSSLYAGRPMSSRRSSYAAHADWQRREVHPMHARVLGRRTTRGRCAAESGRSRVRIAGGSRAGRLSVPAVGRDDERVAPWPGRTPFVASLAAAAATLARYSGGPHVEIGITASVKDHPAAAPLVGYFLNTLPIRIDVSARRHVRRAGRRCR